jgi:hypothetical protein
MDIALSSQLFEIIWHILIIAEKNGPLATGMNFAEFSE